MLDNCVGQIRSHLWIHVAAGVFTLLLVVVGGGAFFYLLFAFLRRQEVFGPPLMEAILGMVLLAFFSMLIFSNLIITLTTTYISKETEFLVGLPIGFRSLFSVKLVESVFYSSWAFLLISLPIVFAYGISKSAPFGFYPLALALGIPFLVIPAAIGALLTMIISAFMPARRTRTYSIILLAAAIGVTAVIVRLMGLRSMIFNASVQDIGQIMALLNIGSVPLLPNYSLARGMQAASERSYAEAGYWFLCLLSTAMMTVQVCIWAVPRLYYRGWVLAKEAASATYATSRRSLFVLLDRLFAPCSPPVRALVGKDLRTFWRDPAQWSQLIILFGLLVIYIANIRGMQQRMRGLDMILKQWPIIVSFFNIGATCFVLSILTTRFIYPMLSLEGKQYWVIGLAPFPKNKLIWEKFWLCIAASACIAIVLMVFSNRVLGVNTLLAWIGLGTITVLGFGLTSLAVGLGAMYPNFKEDNPARIANGLGGTANIVFSLAYIAANLALELPPTFFLMTMTDRLSAASRLALLVREMWPCLIGLLAINVVVIVAPVRIGIRRWNEHEFHL